MDPASASSVGARTALITLAISVARPVEFTGQPLVMPRALASLTCDAMALGTSAIAGFSTRARLSRGHARDSLNAETVPTSGYRKTPVLQIGADIYCDSQLIMRELERLHPTPSFYPAGRGAADALAWW